MLAAAQAATSAPLGGHLWHLIAGVAPVVVAVVVVVVERIRDRGEPDARAYLARPAARALLSADSFGISPARLPQRKTAKAPRAPRPKSLRRTTSLTLAALGLLAAAGVHVTVMPEHFRESWLYGAFFLGTASAQVAAAALIWLRPTRWRLRAIGGASVGVVALWAWTRVVGVPLGPGAGATESIGALDVVASAAELVTALGCFAAAAVPALRLRRSVPSVRTGSI